jgi:hypothetical protein
MLMAVVAAMLVRACLALAAEHEHEIKVEWYDPNGRWDIPLVCFEVMREDPSVICTRFSPLQVPGAWGTRPGRSWP